MKTVEERFLSYISYCTTSDAGGTEIPSSPGEWELAKVLEQELRDLGLSRVRLSAHCYVYGLLPATPGMEHTQSIGFISHMDTAPDYPGKNVRPQRILNYDGKDVLLAGSGAWLRPDDFPDLKEAVGQTLITTDGTTLLGADDKAGVAEIMTALEELIASGTPHGDIWVGFTPDEEVGAGADAFELSYFKADYAYTVDGDDVNAVSYENFNAADACFEIRGVNVHPGEAKGIMKNAALIGCEIAASLPAQETPAHTCGRQGFYHLEEFSGSVSSARLSYIIRDHDKATFEARQKTLRQLEEKMNGIYGKATVKLTVTPAYENMRSVLEDKMYIVDLAMDAIQKNGMTPVAIPIRGGTDGARLSFMGLPCPDLGTGGHGFHGPYEHITVESMEKMVAVLQTIATHPAEK